MKAWSLFLLKDRKYQLWNRMRTIGSVVKLSVCLNLETLMKTSGKSSFDNSWLVATTARVQADVAAARRVVCNPKRKLVFFGQRVDVLDHLLLKLVEHLPADV